MSKLAGPRLVELYDLREAIEIHAVTKLAESFPPAQEYDQVEIANKELAEVFDLARRHGWNRDRSDCWLLADAKFHVSLLRATGNRSLLRFVHEMAIMPTIFGWRPEFVPGTAHQRIHKEHEEVLEAIAQGNVEIARRVMASHLQEGLAVALRSLDEKRHLQDRFGGERSEDPIFGHLAAIEKSWTEEEF
jgi:DNA-binding GntR family transcriptional regulator